MTWCQIDDNPLSEPKIAYFSDTYIGHFVSMTNGEKAHIKR